MKHFRFLFIDKRYFTLLLAILFFSPCQGSSQEPETDTLSIKSSPNIDVFTRSLDSLVNVWYATTTPGLVVDTIYENAFTHSKDFNDSILIRRLGKIVSAFPLTYNNHVKSFIKLYTLERREQVETMLGLSDYYFPLFEAELDAAGLPLELKYLPVIESALNPRAFSRAGASGLWQFMYYTGKQYGLEINSYVDERRDPHKSTRAAVKFLSDLYDIYGDWQLVIAAYNCGPGNVNRAIRRSGGKRNFWELFYLLPRETRGYVPAFIAATYTFHYHKEHNLKPRPTLLPVATDTVMISKPLHFSQVAEMMNIPIDIVRQLNPQYRRDIIPAQNQSYPLRLAFHQSTFFVSREDTIYNYNRSKFFPNNQLVIKPGSTTAGSAAPPPGKAKIYYTVKSGDVVGLIADWFDVYTSSLRYWNNIRRNIIRVGQKLVIYVDKDKVDYYKEIARQKSGYSSSSADNQLADSGKDGDYIYYTVGHGDSVWSIAKKYPGVTDTDILRLNNIKNARSIKPGQKLKIKPKS
ncbi:transglycosylase SLT domain-containing protein [Thermophagus sp. OGC60D27]|uniref:transglycosylase SLT domain-containing protein n=1 Tax=Thermophagus sp. OGC60D27 TaxID=3458415 RepID=UPI004038183E